jgi:predicted Zn-dependent protease
MNSVDKGSQSRLVEKERRITFETERIMPSTTITRGQSSSVTSQTTWDVWDGELGFVIGCDEVNGRCGVIWLSILDRESAREFHDYNLKGIRIGRELIWKKNDENGQGICRGPALLIFPVL